MKFNRLSAFSFIAQVMYCEPADAGSWASGLYVVPHIGCETDYDGERDARGPIACKRTTFALYELLSVRGARRAPTREATDSRLWASILFSPLLMLSTPLFSFRLHEHRKANDAHARRPLAFQSSQSIAHRAHLLARLL